MKIAELPFHERPVLELLGFAEGRDELDRDWAGYGWARVPRIWLVDRPGRAGALDRLAATPRDAARRGDASLEDLAAHARPLDDVLVIAVHSPDDSEPISDDIELELDLEPGRSLPLPRRSLPLPRRSLPLPRRSLPLPRRSVIVMLSDFLATWLPRLPAAAHVVLVLCNPHRATPRPADRPVHYALGDVEAWLDERTDDRKPEVDRSPRLMLVAETWCTLEP
jgi:hypothetical protein